MKSGQLREDYHHKRCIYTISLKLIYNALALSIICNLTGVKHVYNTHTL